MWMRKNSVFLMDNGVDTSLALEETDLVVDLWEAQPCLWDPE